MRLLFSGIGILFYTSICTYLGARTLGLVRYFFPGVRLSIYWPVFILLCYAFIIANFIRIKHLQWINIISACWIAVLLYLLLLFALFDLVRLALLISHKTVLTPQFNALGIGIAFCLCFLLIAYGSVHVRSIRTAEYNVPIAKQNTDLRIALVSDLHIGPTVNKIHIEKIVNGINKAEPDIVCIAGDIFDGHIESIGNLQELNFEFQKIQAPMGIFACLGNHDVDRMFPSGGSTRQIEDFLQKAGVTLLEDEVIQAGDTVYIAGRRDARPIGMNAKRKTAAELLTGFDRNKTIIVLDHQPTDFAEIEKTGADLVLCGHTHKGQLFPANLMTRGIYKKAGGVHYGLWKGKTLQAVVTSGAGFWGPPIRIGTNSEVAVINLQPDNTRQFIDSTGRELIIPRRIEHIIPSGITAQMYLLAIAPDLLCSLASRYRADLAEYIPELVQKLPVSGQIYGSSDMNPESIAGLKPDLIIDIGEPKDTARADFEDFGRSVGLPAVHISASMYTAPDAFRSLGRLLEREERGEELAQFCEHALEESSAAARRAGVKPKVLYCLGPSGTNVMAAGSFQSEAIDIMTYNVAVVNNPSSAGTGSETDMEQIYVWNPDIVLFAPDSIYHKAGSDPLWSKLPAVQKGNYFCTPSGPYNWLTSPPSINRYLGLLWLGKLLYGADYDLYPEAAEYYRLFYGFQLSRAQYEKITEGSLR